MFYASRLGNRYWILSNVKKVNLPRRSISALFQMDLIPLTHLKSSEWNDIHAQPVWKGLTHSFIYLFFYTKRKGQVKVQFNMITCNCIILYHASSGPLGNPDIREGVAIGYPLHSFEPSFIMSQCVDRKYHFLCVSAVQNVNVFEL